MRKKTMTATAALEQADARTAKVRDAIGKLRGQDEQLAAERDAAARALQRTLAAHALGDATDADVAAARKRITTNTAAIADYRALMHGLRQSLEQAEAEATGVLRDRREAYERELAEAGRALLERRAALEARLEALRADMRPVSMAWRRLATVTGLRLRETDQGRDSEVVLDHAGYAVRVGSNHVTQRQEATVA